MAKASGHSALKDGGASAASEAVERWRAAQRWRRWANAELASVGLTLTQWLVLESARALVRESGDAVSQKEVSVRVELDQMTVSQVMRVLDKKGFVSRGPDMEGRAYRVFVTSQGDALVARGWERLQAVANPEEALTRRRF
jgi:DNA-binding MarR family transcriptional regulator